MEEGGGVQAEPREQTAEAGDVPRPDAAERGDPDSDHVCRWSPKWPWNEPIPPRVADHLDSLELAAEAFGADIEITFHPKRPRYDM